jgi:hypothetical protein
MNFFRVTVEIQIRKQYLARTPQVQPKKHEIIKKISPRSEYFFQVDYENHVPFPAMTGPNKDRVYPPISQETAFQYLCCD